MGMDVINAAQNKKLYAALTVFHVMSNPQQCAYFCAADVFETLSGVMYSDEKSTMAILPSVCRKKIL